METESNSPQSNHSNHNPSVTKSTSEPSTDLKRTAGPSSSSSNIANNLIMGKCLSICKEPRRPFLGNRNGLADAQSSSMPDRIDPSQILTNTSRGLSGIDKTNRTIGRPLTLSDNEKHLSHLRIAFVALSQKDREKKNLGEQNETLNANNSEGRDRAEKEEQTNEQPAISEKRNVERRTREEHRSVPPSQENRGPSSNDAANNTPNEGQLGGEEDISPQSLPSRHRLSHIHSERLDSQDTQDIDQPSGRILPTRREEQDINRNMQNERQDTSDTPKSVSSRRMETPERPEVTGQCMRCWSPLHREESPCTCQSSESVKESNMKTGNPHRLSETSESYSYGSPVVTRFQNATELDILSPGVLDGPAMKLGNPPKLQLQKSLIQLCLPGIQVLRLPRLQECQSFDLDSLLHDVAQNSLDLREVVIEDAGHISNRTAVSLANCKNLKRLEVYDPRVSLLLALGVGSTELEEVCFRGLTAEVERELRLYFILKGSSLKSLSLNFSLSIRQAGWSLEDKEFFRRMLMFLQRAVPEEMAELQTLEISSCASYEVKHSFDAPGSWITSVATELLLCRIDEMIRRKERPYHPKQSEMSLTEIKLRGHFTALRDCLTTLSWVNQDCMEIELQLPGVSAIYPRGFGIMKPVALTFLQVDQFISKGSMSSWLELTALREIDIGEASFVQQYNSDVSPLRTATRKLLVTSRESLSRVRICYNISSRDSFSEIHKIVAQIIPLTPLVKHVDISRDIVLYSSLEDYEYVHTIMSLRGWQLKTLQLVSPRNYGSVQPENRENEYDENRAELFVRKLPSFLAVLATGCPKLEELVVEFEDMTGRWEESDEKTRLMDCARKALEVYERVVPSVKVETVHGQLDAWERYG